MKCKKCGTNIFIWIIPQTLPTAQEVELYLELLNNMKANSFFILNIVPIGCINCNLKDWLNQKKKYFGWQLKRCKCLLFDYDNEFCSYYLNKRCLYDGECLYKEVSE
jgi:hypothetical protein